MCIANKKWQYLNSEANHITIWGRQAQQKWQYAYAKMATVSLLAVHKMGDAFSLLSCQVSIVQQGFSELFDNSLCIMVQPSSAEHDVVLCNNLYKELQKASSGYAKPRLVLILQMQLNSIFTTSEGLTLLALCSMYQSAIKI